MPIDETTIGRKPVKIVRIDQPACGHVFGSAPCAAIGEACYQTRASCRDASNYAQSAASEFALYFGEDGARGPADVPYVLPFLVSVSTSPTKINLSGADRNANPLGVRARATIQFRDVPHSDRLVDPYLATRSYEPLSRGTFWSKWNARNRYGKAGAKVTIYFGYEGQLLSEMRSQVFFAEALDLNGSDKVTLKCRDILVKASDEKAQIPALSPGELHADINATQKSIEVAGAVLDDYSPSGTIRINSECMKYSARSLNGNGRLNFTITSRGTDSTTAKAHNAEDQVQECYRFESVAVDQAINDILSGFTTIDPALLDLTGWADEAASYLTSYSLQGVITRPTAVKAILGEICEQTQVFLWWDVFLQKVRLRAVRAITSPPPVLSEGSHLLGGSVALKEKPLERVSRVWMYFDQQNPTEGLTKEENYRRVQGSLDLSQEAPEMYGDPAIRRIFARFIRSRAVALQTTGRILTRYRDVPVELSFAVDAKDRGIDIGDIVLIDHYKVQDVSGDYERRPWIITSAHEDVPGERARFTAEDASLAGRIVVIMADGSPDYQGDRTDQFDGAWIGDNSGRLSDGQPCAKIQ